jgi:hypothetical protein
MACKDCEQKERKKMNSSFVWGVVVGAGGVWAFHKFVKPMPTNKAG